MPLRTRRSSTLGRPWLFGKNGRSRSICASVSQNKLLISQLSSRTLNHESWIKSMGPDPSIQRRVIDELLQNGGFDVVFDDDGSGESADVVAIKKEGDVITVAMFHCKYASNLTPSARVGDLYEVCGQTQKAIRWRERPDLLFARLRRREMAMQKKHGVSRLEKGSVIDLIQWHNRWNEFDYRFEMTAVQPGYSKSEAIRQQDKGQLEILAATQSLLMDTWAIPFTFLCSH